MNTVKYNGVAAIAPQREMFGGLFPVDSDLGRCIKRKESKSGAVRIGLLPLKSKTGDSIASILGLKGAAAEAAKDRLSAEMKVKQSGVVGMLAASNEYTGGSMTIRKSGDIVLVYKKHAATGLTKAEVLAKLTDAEREEIAKAYLESQTTPAPEAPAAA